MTGLSTRVVQRWDRLRNRLRPDVHQRSHATAPDRHPELFAAVRDHLEVAGVAAPRLLSFGCSSGEECLALRRAMPASRVVGADVSPAILARARSTCAGDPRIEIVPSRPGLLDARAPFDAVFALSVLCRHRETRRRRDCSRVYPFAHFESALERLAAWLAPGGLLVLHNTTYRFVDTAIARDFDDVTPEGLRGRGHVAVFDRRGRRLDPSEDTGALFRKRPRA